MLALAGVLQQLDRQRCYQPMCWPSKLAQHPGCANLRGCRAAIRAHVVVILPNRLDTACVLPERLRMVRAPASTVVGQQLLPHIRCHSAVMTLWEIV
jgi:hypothetical protein